MKNRKGQERKCVCVAYFKGLLAVYMIRLTRSTTNLGEGSQDGGRGLNCSCRVDGVEELSHVGRLKALNCVVRPASMP
jgi:hypothetical protein